MGTGQIVPAFLFKNVLDPRVCKTPVLTKIEGQEDKHTQTHTYILRTNKRKRVREETVNTGVQAIGVHTLACSHTNCTHILIHCVHKYTQSYSHT